MVTRVLRSRIDILNALEASRPKTTLKLIALYTSFLDAVIDEPRLISIPINDLLLDGWGVFDTLNIYNSVPYQMISHIDRLFYSAENSKMTLSFTKENMCNRLSQMLETYPDTRIRFFISGSDGFYILAYNDASQAKPIEIEEVTVSVAPKPIFLASIKTTNYLPNALCVLEARAKGGYMGIFLDDDGYLAESAIANIAIVQNNKFLSPLPKYVLEGTTLKRVLAFCQQLVTKGELEYAGRADITVQQAYESQEMMFLGGDSVIAITKLDGRVISNGVGKITEKIFNFLSTDKVHSISDI